MLKNIALLISMILLIFSFTVNVFFYDTNESRRVGQYTWHSRWVNQCRQDGKVLGCLDSSTWITSPYTCSCVVPSKQRITFNRRTRNGH